MDASYIMFTREETLVGIAFPITILLKKPKNGSKLKGKNINEKNGYSMSTDAN